MGDASAAAHDRFVAEGDVSLAVHGPVMAKGDVSAAAHGGAASRLGGRLQAIHERPAAIGSAPDAPLSPARLQARGLPRPTG